MGASAAGPGWRHHREQLPLEIAVGIGRNVKRVDAYLPVRRRGLDTDVLWNASPPRVRVEEAALDVASAAPSDLDALGVLADVCQGRNTTARRLITALDARERIRGRAWLRAVLVDIAEGTHSVLEHGYLVRVERAHGLPGGRRQSRSHIGPRRYRDVSYAAFGFDVELDSRLFHDSARARDADLDRDLDSATEGRSTVRLGWGPDCELA